eukprot:3424354-Rhodomonas_salina.1
MQRHLSSDGLDSGVGDLSRDVDYVRGGDNSSDSDKSPVPEAAGKINCDDDAGAETGLHTFGCPDSDDSESLSEHDVCELGKVRMSGRYNSEELKIGIARTVSPVCDSDTVLPPDLDHDEEKKTTTSEHPDDASPASASDEVRIQISAELALKVLQKTSSDSNARSGHGFTEKDMAYVSSALSRLKNEEHAPEVETPTRQKSMRTARERSAQGDMHIVNLRAASKSARTGSLSKGSAGGARPRVMGGVLRFPLVRVKAAFPNITLSEEREPWA